MILKTAKRLDPKTIAALLALKNVLPAEEAATYNVQEDKKDDRDAALRKTEVRWIYADAYPELYRSLAEVVIPHAKELGLPPGVQMERALQLATYYVGHHFGWHFDGTPRDRSRRILSMSILLTDEFEGGRLEFRSPGAPRLKKPGDTIIFHSQEVHRVTPVTRGQRDAVVAWFHVT